MARDDNVVSLTAFRRDRIPARQDPLLRLRGDLLQAREALDAARTRVTMRIASIEAELEGRHERGAD